MGDPRTYGVDLVAQREKTAICMIEWRDDGGGRVDCPQPGVADDQILMQMARNDVSVTAIDAPFGWPRTFVESLLEFAARGVWPDSPGTDVKQEAMRLRATDLAVQRETKLTPLSVSTDKIGVVALARMACTGSDHCLDAPICALVARAWELDRVIPTFQLAMPEARAKLS